MGKLVNLIINSKKIKAFAIVFGLLATVATVFDFFRPQPIEKNTINAQGAVGSISTIGQQGSNYIITPEKEAHKFGDGWATKDSLIKILLSLGVKKENNYIISVNVQMGNPESQQMAVEIKKVLDNDGWKTKQEIGTNIMDTYLRGVNVEPPNQDGVVLITVGDILK